MKFVLIAACTYAICALHSAIAHDLAIAGIAPHLILAGLVVIVVRVGQAQGVLLAAVWGVLADCLSEGRLGPQIVCYAIATLILRYAANQSRINSTWSLAALSLPLIGSVLLINQVCRSFADGRSIDFVPLAIHSAGSALYTGVIVMGAAYVIRLFASDVTERSATASHSVSNQWRMLTE
ncbi:MAG TPA: rod shape-determining protein MreD [Planctomycetaceae bacterium]|jgi:rod shape-determining protein MreD